MLDRLSLVADWQAGFQKSIAERVPCPGFADWPLVYGLAKLFLAEHCPARHLGRGTMTAPATAVKADRIEYGHLDLYKPLAPIACIPIWDYRWPTHGG